MTEQVLAWWRARTSRERTLLQFAAVFVLAAVVPAWTYLAASSFRERAAADLAAARRLESQVASLAEAGRARDAAPQSADTSLRGRMLAAAEAAGLTPARMEAAGGDRVRVAFEPADSVSVYRWIAMVGAGGALVTRTSITRVSDSEQVNAEFDVMGTP